MRYIGGKSLLLDRINTVIDENIGTISSVIDIFAGSTVVSDNFKREGKQVISNDFLFFSFVIARGTIGLNTKPSFEKLNIDNPISYLNKLSLEDTNIDLKNCFIYNHYSPNETCQRMYFQNKNAIKIDLIRQTIEYWFTNKLISQDGYYYLLAALLNAVPFVSNITGIYAAYLKYWDPRTYHDIELIEPFLYSNGKSNQCYNMDYTEVLKFKSDLLYADPPYNSREYLPNYHLLETIACYDNPEIYGVTGMRRYDHQKSEFCKKAKVASAFEKLIRDCNSKYIMISYNNEGLLSTKELTNLCQTYCVKDTFQLFEFDYRRYKNKIPNDTKGLKEQLYFLRRH